MALHVSDTINFLGNLSFRRVWNASQLLSSFYLSRFLKKPKQWGKPMTISVEPTTACNLRCPECPSGMRIFSRDTGNIKQDFFRKNIDQVAKDLLYLIFYFQGEPFIHKGFLEMVKYAKSKRIYTITSTNGHFLDDSNAKATVESGLDRLIISVDGTSQEVYQQYRKEGQLSKVLEGARNIVKWKEKLNSKTPHLIFQFLVVRPNEHQIPEIYQLANEIGVNEVKLKTAQIYDYKNGNSLIPNNEKYSRYKKNKNGTYSIKNKLLNHCWKLWHSCVITWDGLVVPCCFDKDAKYRLGNLNEATFEQIWHGNLYQDFRKEIKKGRDQIDICKNCTEGCTVWT